MTIRCLIFLLVICVSFVSVAQDTPGNFSPAIVVHGGAGNINRQNVDETEEALLKDELARALQVGYEVLKEGGSSLNAVEETVRYLENSPYFNAGKGAVFNNKGEHELDASVMDGKTLNAGAVAGVKHVKNPISAAIAVMHHTKHVLLAGEGAEEFARTRELEMVDNEYFDTEKRKEHFRRLKQQEGEGKIEDAGTHKYGTVGAVALDMYGNIAAGTSTGGLSNKKYGRIGDSPIVGAGTYANNKTCGISSTGIGEYFIRGVIAYDISAIMEYKGKSLDKAARKVVHEKLAEMGGEGGVIGLDRKGNITMVFNTEGMFRGYIDKNGNMEVLMFR